MIGADGGGLLLAEYAGGCCQRYPILSGLLAIILLGLAGYGRWPQRWDNPGAIPHPFRPASVFNGVIGLSDPPTDPASSQFG